MYSEFINRVINEIEKSVKGNVYANIDERCRRVSFKIVTIYFEWSYPLEMSRYFELGFEEEAFIFSLLQNYKSFINSYYFK